MALPLGLRTGLGLRQAATSETTFSAFELYPVHSGEPVKHFKQRSHRIQGGNVAMGSL